MNLPLPPGTGNAGWLSAVERLVAALTEFAADAIVVSFGADAHRDDPQSFFGVDEAGFAGAATLLRAAGNPCVVVQEGGYSTKALVSCGLAFLEGLQDPSRCKGGRP